MAQEEDALTRRTAIAVGIAGAAAVATAAAAHGHTPAAAGEPSDERVGRAAGGRMPVAFLPHGGGPWPFVDTGIGEPAELEALSSYLKSVAQLPPTPPKAVLVISAHWEEPVPTVMTSAHPPMLYDYYGFPPDSYRISWPAPGDAALAARVRRALAAAGIANAENCERGFDHGTFVPLKLMYPKADIPTVQLSLKQGLDPREHLAIGRALAPLRDEGVFIVGSGMTYHNLRAFNAGSRPVAEAFDAWLRDAATAEPAERDRRLSDWQAAPEARRAHPREEHLLPLMVVAGADLGKLAYGGTILGLRLSAYHFG
jgi:aromatic ring-opening dioxygenase catalytic subunit (LigB family)